MSVEEDCARFGERLNAHEAKHDEHRDEFVRLWTHVETGNKAREATNLQMAGIVAEVRGLSESVGSLSAFIRGDLRKAIIGGVGAIAVLAALLAIALTVGPSGVSIVVTRWLNVAAP